MLKAQQSHLQKGALENLPVPLTVHFTECHMNIEIEACK